MARAHRQNSWELAGAIHCHSVLSDGSGSVPHILRAARRAGLDYLILTDHDTLVGRETGPDSPGEGYRDGLLFLVGSEVSPPQNHYLALGAAGSPPRKWPLQRVIDSVAGTGGLGFIGHPFDRGSPLIGVPPYPWTDRNVTGYAGIEVWNFFSQLLGEARGLLGAAGAVLAPFWMVRRPPPEALALWDELGRQGPVVGLGGVDAHGVSRRLLWLPLVVANYRLMLRTVWTHVLLNRKPSGDWRADGAALLEALGRGRAFISSPAGGDARGFRFTAEAEGTGPLGMGDETRLQGREARLEVECPGRGTIRLVRDGRTVAVRRQASRLQVRVKEPGVYRVEVSRRRLLYERAWILSNPIYLRP